MPNAAIDLFCGIGGLTKGLELAGINVIAGYDFDESCRFAYEHNNNALFYHADITQLDSRDIIKLYPKNCVRILAGCAPCQPFSKYSQRYRKDGYKDDKWKLLYSFSKIIEEVNPDIIAMENVPELAKTNVFADFERKMTELHYHIFSDILFCPDYGAPQNRKRLVFLGSRFGDISMIAPTRVRFEAIAVGVGLALRKDPNLAPVSTDWIESDEFKKHTTTHASNSLARVIGRVEYVEKQLLGDNDANNINQVYDKNAHHNSYKEKAIEMINYILNDDVLILDKKATDISGNLDAEKIRNICNDHGIRYHLTAECKGGVKLTEVKEKRNNLAHGTESFMECGRNYTMDDLEKIKEQALVFISDILTGMKEYYDGRCFLCT